MPNDRSTTAPAAAPALSRAGLDRLSQALRARVDAGELAGAVAVVARGDQVEVISAGQADLASGAPMRRDAIFRLTSMTKPVTAVAALILLDEGKLSLDDAIEKWLPELADRRVLRNGLDSELADTVPAKRPITVRDLMTFRAGYGLILAPPGTHPIQRAMDALGVQPGATPYEMGPDEFLRRLGTLPLLHQPGERWVYNTGADILGVLIERVSGLSLDRFFAERIFAPLGMKDTGFWVPAEKIGRLATQYERDSKGGLKVFDEPRTGLWSRPPAMFSGSGRGGLVTTAGDYLAFTKMLLHHGRHGSKQLVSAENIAAMTTDQIPPAQKARSPFAPGFWDNNGWGYGVQVLIAPDGIAKAPGRFGWAGGTGPAFFVDPTEGLIGILLIQRMLAGPGDQTIAEEFSKNAYAAMAESN